MKGEYFENKTENSGLKELDKIPSPYLNGLFDYLFTDGNGTDYQVIIETNRGCPYSCTYCVWGKGGYNKGLRYHSLERVFAEIEWCGVHKIKYVFNSDSNFGIDKRDIQIAKMLSDTKDKYGFPEKFRACFAKNSDERIYEIARILFENKLEKGITLSFQSMDEQVVQNIKRQNIKLSTYRGLLDKFNNEGISAYTELIIGLPGETYATFVSGIENVLEMGLRGQLFIYLCEAYPNTELYDQGYRERFGIVTKRIILTETHGTERTKDDIQEYQDIVISTDSLPLVDWRKIVVFSWMTMFLYCLKAGFFVLLYLFHRLNIKFTSLIEYICESKIPMDCSMLRDELVYYEKHIELLLQGQGRGVMMPEFSDFYWDMEETSFLRAAENPNKFYAQMLFLLKDFLKTQNVYFVEEELREVIQYQKMRMPCLNGEPPCEFKFNFNIPEFFESCVYGRKICLERKTQVLRVFTKDYGNNKAEFAREVILWGRKSNNTLFQSEWR